MEAIPWIDPDDYPTRAEAAADARTSTQTTISDEEWLERYHAARDKERAHLATNGWTPHGHGRLWVNPATGRAHRLADALVELERSRAAA